MNDMLTNAMRMCHNFFDYASVDGEFTIKVDGSVNIPTAIDGQYVAVQDSVLHDGVYRWSNGCLEDAPEVGEVFTGTIWLLSPPTAFINLCEEMAEFDRRSPKGAVQSESFGNYSRTMANGSDGLPAGWESVFGSRLSSYRKMFTEVGI